MNFHHPYQILLDQWICRITDIGAEFKTHLLRLNQSSQYTVDMVDDTYIWGWSTHEKNDEHEVKVTLVLNLVPPVTLISTPVISVPKLMIGIVGIHEHLVRNSPMPIKLQECYLTLDLSLVLSKLEREDEIERVLLLLKEYWSQLKMDVIKYTGNF